MISGNVHVYRAVIGHERSQLLLDLFPRVELDELVVLRPDECKSVPEEHFTSGCELLIDLFSSYLLAEFLLLLPD